MEWIRIFMEWIFMEFFNNYNYRNFHGMNIIILYFIIIAITIFIIIRYARIKTSTRLFTIMPAVVCRRVTRICALDDDEARVAQSFER